MSVPPKPIVDLDTHDEPVVRLTQVCRYLGVDRRTALKWIAGGLLPAFKLPGGDDAQWRIELAAVRRFVDTQRLKAVAAAQRSTSSSTVDA